MLEVLGESQSSQPKIKVFPPWLATLLEGVNNQMFKVFFKNLTLFKVLEIKCENSDKNRCKKYVDLNGC